MRILKLLFFRGDFVGNEKIPAVRPSSLACFPDAKNSLEWNSSPFEKEETARNLTLNIY